MTNSDYESSQLVWILCILLHLALVRLANYEFRESRFGVFWAGVLFWWSDFWAGLCCNVAAAMLFTSGIDDPVRSFVLSLVYGMFMEEVFYDLPLKVIKCGCGPSQCWILAVGGLGFYYLGLGATQLYSFRVVALVGHHAILYGIAQWMADILKAVVKKHVCDYVCQRPQKQNYQLLISELEDPLPKVPRTEEGESESESQEDPGKV